MGRLSSGARDECEQRPDLRVSVAHDLAVIDFLGDFAADEFSLGRVGGFTRRKSRYWRWEMRLPGIRIPVEMLFFLFFFLVLTRH